jgi:hypothetical protein
MGKWSTHLRCYIPLYRKRFLCIVSLFQNKFWTVLLFSRGKHRFYCYCIENCYNYNSTCVGNGPQITSRTCDCLRDYDWDVQTTLCTAPTSRPVTSIYLGSFRDTWLAFDSHQTLTWSKSSFTSTPGYKPWCHSGTNAYIAWIYTVWCVPSATHVLFIHWSPNKFLGIKIQPFF